MSELSMTVEERQQFLASMHVGVLAAERPDGPPLLSPIWYRYAAGGAVEFVIGTSSEKARVLRASGRASLCAQREEVPYAYVTVDGPVEFGAADEAVRTDIATRYLGAELGAQYVVETAHVDDVLVRLQPARWRTTDYSKVGFGT
jgi:uncharacterized protein